MCHETTGGRCVPASPPSWAASCAPAACATTSTARRVPAATSPLDDVRLSWAGSHSHATMDYEGAYTLLPSAARYEFGTRALADFAGLARAVEWMEDIGLEGIDERIQSLVGHAIEVIDRTDGLGVSSPRTRPDRSGVFVLELPEGCDATELYSGLREDDGILASPVRQERDFRLSIHFFNTRDEIDAAIAAIAARCA